MTLSASRDVDGEAEALQRAHRVVRRHVEAAEVAQAGEAQRGLPLPGRLGAGGDDGAGLAAAQIEDHAGGRLDGVGHQRGVDAALEALAGIAR